MHGLAFALLSALIPNPAASPDAGAQVALEGPRLSVSSPAIATDTKRKKRNKGERLMIAGAITYGLGTTAVWATAGATGGFGPELARSRRRQVGPSLAGFVLGGSAMLEGSLLVGIAATKAGRDAPKDRRRSKVLRASGGAILGVGALGLTGAAMFWPGLRRGCRAGVACAMGVVTAGSTLTTAGAGMMGWGSAIRPYEDRPQKLSKRFRTPLIAGTALLGMGYFTSVTAGMGFGREGGAAARRVRNRSFIPVVGPWIAAAGPDAPLPTALILGGLGTMQIAGAVVLAVGGLSLAHHQRRVRLSLVPNRAGATLVGRF